MPHSVSYTHLDVYKRQHLKIPAAYYDRMLSDYPELLAENVNSWFQREPTQRMVRTLDGTVRAFLSNRYRRIDNLDIAEIVLPVIQQMEDAYFESCQITDSRIDVYKRQVPHPYLHHTGQNCTGALRSHHPVCADPDHETEQAHRIWR